MSQNMHFFYLEGLPRSNNYPYQVTINSENKALTSPIIFISVTVQTSLLIKISDHRQLLQQHPEIIEGSQMLHDVIINILILY